MAAQHALIARGERAVDELASQWPQVPLPERIARLIGELDDDRFGVRQAASRELLQIGSAAEEALRRAVNDSLSAEVRHRARIILSRMDRNVQPPHVLFEVRAVQVLVGIGSDSARELLSRFVESSPNDRTVACARLSLAKLRRNSE